MLPHTLYESTVALASFSNASTSTAVLCLHEIRRALRESLKCREKPNKYLQCQPVRASRWRGVARQAMRKHISRLSRSAMKHAEHRKIYCILRMLDPSSGLTCSCSENPSNWQPIVPIMIWIDADVLLLRSERIATAFERLELVVCLQVGPTPDAAIDYMR